MGQAITSNSPRVRPIGATSRRTRLGDFWSPSRARLWLVGAALATWLPALGIPLRGWLDFSAFYAAGRLALTPDVARLEPLVAWQAANGFPITPFAYPPGVALAYLPLSALPYGVAGAIHLALMTAALIVAALIGASLLSIPKRWALLGTFAWAPASAGVLSGQNTAVALLLVALAAAAVSRGRERLPGALIGGLAYKPQLAAPLVGLLVLRSRWRGLAVVAAVLTGHYVAGMVATGGNPAWPLDWVTTLRAYADADFRANGWQAISLPAIGHRLEIVAGIPSLAIAGYLLGCALVLVCVPAMRRLPTVESIALACACGLVVSPHAWIYDATLLLPALGVLAAGAARRGWLPRDRWLLAGAYAVALSWPLGGILGLTAVVAIVVAVPLMLRVYSVGSTAAGIRGPAVGALPLGQ